MVRVRHTRIFEGYFRWRLRRGLARNVFAIYVRGFERVPEPDGTPAVMVANHNGWWDGLVDYYLLRETFGYSGYVMMDEAYLGAFPFLGFVGGFTVDKRSPARAASGVRYAIELLKDTGNVLLIYPQGIRRHTDARPLGFKPGAAFIATKVAPARVIPLARRYEMRAEDRPDVFYLCGEAVPVEPWDNYKKLAIDLEKKVTALVDELARYVVSEELDEFKKIFQGNLSGNKRIERKIFAVKKALGLTVGPFEPYNP